MPGGIRPRPRRHAPYLGVRIFRTHDAMLADARRDPCLNGWPDRFFTSSGAIAHGHTVLRKGRVTGDLGIVWLSQADLGGGVVSHELLHMALRWRQWRGQRWPRTLVEEERLCYVLGAMVQEFWTALYLKAGVKRIRVSA